MKVDPAKAPPFCACCLEERVDLESVQERSLGGVERVVWKCTDCRDAGPLSELVQHELTDGEQNNPSGGTRRQSSRRGGKA